MKFDFKNKTVLVCGSSQGIGLAIAQQFAKCDANVIMFARNEEKLKQAILTLSKKEAQNHHYFIADFNENNQVKQAINDITANHKIDVLVNNTGGPPAGKAIDADIDQFLSAFQLHLINNQIITSACVPNMINNQWGRIINIISTSVKVPLNNLGVSNTIRGAVGNWSKTLANELAALGVTVNNVLPGATETERLKNIIVGKSQKTNVEEIEVKNEMLHEIPMRRFGKPEEVAYAALFLASNFASYITGTNMVVDGGRTPCL